MGVPGNVRERPGNGERSWLTEAFVLPIGLALLFVLALGLPVLAEPVAKQWLTFGLRVIGLPIWPHRGVRGGVPVVLVT